MDDVRSEIIATITYFSIFDYPLTASEIWFYLYSSNKSTLYEVTNILEELCSSVLETSEGFYFFANEKYKIEIRKKRYLLAVDRLQKTKKFIRILSYFPGVEMISFCNSLPLQNSKPYSDIDLFIVTRDGHIWTTRFFVAGFLKFLGLRPSEFNKDKSLCPSFFVSVNGMNMKKLQLANGNDIYMHYWVANIMPIYINNSIDVDFIKKNHWVKEYIANNKNYKTVNNLTIQYTFFEKFIKNFLEYIFLYSIIERYLKRFQKNRLPIALKEMVNESTSVIINDSVLKFHNKDERLKYYNKFIKKFTKIKNNL